MSGDDAISQFTTALASLLANTESMPWTERRDLAHALSSALSSGVHHPDTLALSELLAKDPHPEVRREIAEALIHLPQEECMRLGTILSQDSNFMVARAADRSLSRRRKSADQTRRTTRKLQRVQSKYEAMEAKYGRPVTMNARKLALEFYDTLVGDTIHNMNNIVSPVRITISRLQRQLVSGDLGHDNIKRSLDDMQRQMDYMAHFMAEMREYAKATPVARRVERVADIVSESVRSAQDASAAQGYQIERITMNMEVPNNLTFPVARCQIVSALVHIIRNAIECFSATIRKPRVSVVARTEDNILTVMIEDNGPGIDPETLAALRDFVPRKVTTKLHGTGFGLPTANRYVVEGHGGNLTIDRAPRRGTRITLVIPANGTREDEA